VTIPSIGPRRSPSSYAAKSSPLPPRLRACMRGGCRRLRQGATPDPLPGTLTLTGVAKPGPSPAAVVTADGWAVSFERVLIAMGNAGLGESCSIYAEANYDRVSRRGPPKEGKSSETLYGIGQCDVDFRLQAPTVDALLGDGVTEDEKTELRTPGGDAYVPLGGISADIALSATPAESPSVFISPFGPRFDTATARPVRTGGLAVDLESSVSLTYDIRVEAEAMLRDDVDAAAALRFDPFASADANGDGIVTLDELRAVPIGNVRDGGAFEAGTYEVVDGGYVRGAPVVIASFGDYVYQVLVPTLMRFRDTGNVYAPRGANLD